MLKIYINCLLTVIFTFSSHCITRAGELSLKEFGNYNGPKLTQNRAASLDDKIYSFGGQRIDRKLLSNVFLVDTNGEVKMVDVCELNVTARHSHAVCENDEYTFLFCGGVGKFPLSDYGLVDVRAGEVCLYFDGLSSPLYGHTLSKISDHEFLTIGGLSSDNINNLNADEYLKKSFNFDLRMPERVTENNVDLEIESHSGFFIKNQLFICGGVSPNCEEYSVSNKIKCLDKNLALEQEYDFNGSQLHAGINYNDTIFIFGGDTNSHPSCRDRTNKVVQLDLSFDETVSNFYELKECKFKEYEFEDLKPVSGHAIAPIQGGFITFSGQYTNVHYNNAYAVFEFDN